MAIKAEIKSHGALDELEIVVACEDSVLYESPYLGQHGISLLIRARRQGFSRTVLMDVGQNPTALLENFRLLEIDPTRIDAIVLTHCHYDHTQGLSEVLRAIGKNGVPVIAHPGLFRLHFITSPYLRHVGVMPPDREERIREAGGELYLAREAFPLMPGLFTTGEVKRQTDFEEVGISLFTLQEGALQPDPMPDDLSIIACVAGKGPVIMTGCSHAGIVNIALQAQSLTGASAFEGILGGFHLVEAPEARIRKTCEALRRFPMQWIRAGHCTGFAAQAALYAAFGQAFKPLQTGMRLRVCSSDEA